MPMTTGGNPTSGGIAAFIAVALVLGVAGCSVASSPGPSPSTASASLTGEAAVTSRVIAGFEVQQAGETTLLVDTSDGQMDALIMGTIRLKEGCFVLRSDFEPTPDDAEIPLVFPAGTKLSVDGLTADVPGFGTVADGDELRGGGGQIPEPDAGGACARGGSVMVWQSAG